MLYQVKTSVSTQNNSYECGVQDNGEVNMWKFQRGYMSTRANGHGAHSFVGRGMYAAQLQSWLKYFEEDQILVVPLSELKTYEGVQTQMSRVFRHIGLRPVVVADSSHKNKRHYKPMSEDEARPLRKFYKNHNRVFCEMLRKMNHNAHCMSAVEKW